MANKRDLKKAIHHVTAALFTECVMFKEFIPGTDSQKADLLLDDILAFQEDLLVRINNYGTKDESTLVRAYFKLLSADIVKDAQLLFEKINELKK
jgi:hypothetical protein